MSKPPPGKLCGVTKAEKLAQPNKRRAPPHAWKPGVSGNPRGLAVLTPERRAAMIVKRDARREAKHIAHQVELGKLKLDEMAREHAPLAMQTLVEIIKTCPDPSERRQCAVEIFNRWVGLPVRREILDANIGVNHDGVQAVEAARIAMAQAFGLTHTRLIEHEPAPA